MGRKRETKALGTTEVARICHVTPPTVGRWIEDGKLPSFTTGGGHRRVWVADLVAFLREHNIPVPQDLESAVGCKVLIVDDEPTIRQLIAAVIDTIDHGIEVHEAVDGFEAGHKVASLAPRVVILDLRLPGLDGYRVCEMIRADKNMNGVHILAVSGHSVEEARARVLEAGADDFFPKPFDADQLRTKLTEVFTRAGVLKS